MQDRGRERLDRRVQNENYEKDMDYTTQFCRWTLNVIGIWPLIHDRVSKSEKVISIVLIATCSAFLIFEMLSSGLHVLVFEKDLKVKMMLFGPFGFNLSSTIKYCYLGLKGSAIGNCIEYMKNDWKSVRVKSQRKVMTKYATLGRNLTKICMIFLYSGGVSYDTIVPLSSYWTMSENDTSAPLEYPGDALFFDTTKSPTYEILFIVHCLCALLSYTITTAACGLAAAFVTHACGQIKWIKLRLDDLVDGGKEEKTSVKERLSMIIRDHVRVLRFSKEIESIMREICLMELVESTLVICLLEYYFITEWKNNDNIKILTYVILLISFTFNIFIFCYIGELLVDQCKEIGVASYNVEWYRLSDKTSLAFVLMIAMSNNPSIITAGKLIELSLFTFGRVLKSSVVYLNVILTLVE